MGSACLQKLAQTTGKLIRGIFNSPQSFPAMNEIQNLIALLKNNFNGQMWYGNNFTHVLSNITPDTAFTRPFTNAHNIAELLAHLLAWRTFAIQQLKGNTGFTIEIDSEQDWPVYNQSNAAVWQQLTEALQHSQSELETLLSNANNELLQQTVPGTEFNFYILLHGVLHHDVYHLAQIALVKKQLHVQA
ncbi:DinB family protein [Sphingobacteriales bacterium UPWRP_1]|nr:hypothetical protein BVG80_01030 [Sphingobacteriales bacterium TSM_CSM]PSJ72628.1 DinB family protein [Sphingobacteriales bacterium UPWRP_1]